MNYNKQLRDAILKFKDKKNISILCLAKLCQVKQPTINRFLINEKANISYHIGKKIETLIEEDNE